MNSLQRFLKPRWPAQSIICSYRVCRLRAPCRLMLMGMLNDLRGEAVFKNMPSPISATSGPSCTCLLLTSLFLYLKVKCPAPKRSSHVSSRLERSEGINAPGCSLFTRELPVVYQSSKVSAKSSTLMCVSIETATGEAGSMLMDSHLACDTQLWLLMMKTGWAFFMLGQYW